MADSAHSRPHGNRATGNIDNLSTRRRMIGAMAIGAAALAVPVVALPVDPDAAFWALHREWLIVRDDFDHTGVHWLEWERRADGLQRRILACPVFTAKALLAKVEVELTYEGIDLPYILQADARRIDGKEGRA